MQGQRRREGVLCHLVSAAVRIKQTFTARLEALQPARGAPARLPPALLHGLITFGG